MKDITKGFIKDSDGVYRRGRFYIKDGKILRESKLIPDETVKKLIDTFTTPGEAIASALAYSTTIGAPVRDKDLFINKSGESYKVSETYSSNDTVAIITPANNVLKITTKEVIPFGDDKLRNTDKADLPQVPKETKEFISNVDDKNKPDIEEITKKELKESHTITESDATPEFLEDLKNLLNKHCRVSDIKEIDVVELNHDEVLRITFTNDYVLEININANSNLATLKAVADELLK